MPVCPECPIPNLCTQIAGSSALSLKERLTLFNYVVSALADDEGLTNQARDCSNANRRDCLVSIANTAVPEAPFGIEGILATVGDIYLQRRFDKNFGPGKWNKFS